MFKFGKINLDVDTLFLRPFSAFLRPFSASSPPLLRLISSCTMNNAHLRLLMHLLIPLDTTKTGKDAVPETVHHVIYRINPRQKLEWADHEIAVHAKKLVQPYTDQVNMISRLY